VQQNAEVHVPVVHTAVSEILEYPSSQVMLAQVGRGVVVTVVTGVVDGGGVVVTVVLGVVVGGGVVGSGVVVTVVKGVVVTVVQGGGNSLQHVAWSQWPVVQTVASGSFLNPSGQV